MPRLRLHAGGAVRMALVAVLTVGLASAQSGGATGQNPFADLHASLVTAANKTLAESLSDRPWMKAAGSEGDTKPQTRTEPDERVSAAVQRVQQLRPLVDPILQAEGIPSELIAVALVESGGLTMVTSPKGARGVWQFMPDTARRYGLAVSIQRDERVELEKSTRAASRYLRDLYLQFGDWPLALAAYNAGEQTVQRAVEQSGHRDYPSIERLLPTETRNYVPAVLKSMNLFTSRELVSEQVTGAGARTMRLTYASAQPTK